MYVNDKIKNLRQIRGYTLDKLAELTGFTKGYLSKIERSGKTPPFATVQAIAEALQADMEELLDRHSDASGSKNIDIVTRDIGTEEWEKSSSVYSFIPLVNSYRNKYMAPFLFRVKKGATEVTAHDSEEFVYVLEGNVELNYEGRVYRLARGNSFYLDARIKHNFVNPSSEDATLIAVHFNYRKF